MMYLSKIRAMLQKLPAFFFSSYPETSFGVLRSSSCALHRDLVLVSSMLSFIFYEVFCLGEALIVSIPITRGDCVSPCV